MINKKALSKACYFGLTSANACVGAVYLLCQMTVDFNIIVGVLYFLISIISIFLMVFKD